MVCVEFIYKYIYIYRLLDSYSVYLILVVLIILFVYDPQNVNIHLGKIIIINHHLIKYDSSLSSDQSKIKYFRKIF